MSVSERVNKMASAAADLGLTVNEVRTHLLQIAAAAGVARPTKAEVSQLRRRLDWLSARRSGSGDRCPSCQAPVMWGVTAKGKSMPIDPLPHPRGIVTIERTAAGGRLVTVHSRHDELPSGTAYRPHFATCPSTRDRRQVRPPAETECTVCGRRLHPSLVAAGERSHGCKSAKDPLCTECGWVLDPSLVARGLTTHLEVD